MSLTEMISSIETVSVSSELTVKSFSVKEYEKSFELPVLINPACESLVLPSFGLGDFIHISTTATAISIEITIPPKSFIELGRNIMMITVNTTVIAIAIIIPTERFLLGSEENPAEEIMFSIVVSFVNSVFIALYKLCADAFIRQQLDKYRMRNSAVYYTSFLYAASDCFNATFNLRYHSAGDYPCAL